MGRIKPEQEIIYICSVIDKNIEAHKILKDRGLLSENILSQLRNLTEDVAIFINNTENSLSLDIHYNNVDDSIKYVSSVKKYKYISVFHKFLQSTASHYTPSEDDAERLVLYYFRYICMIKQTLENLGIIVLKKLEDFPIYEDNLTKEEKELEQILRELIALTRSRHKMNLNKEVILEAQKRKGVEEKRLRLFTFFVEELLYL